MILNTTVMVTGAWLIIKKTQYLTFVLNLSILALYIFNLVPAFVFGYSLIKIKQELQMTGNNNWCWMIIQLGIIVLSFLCLIFSGIFTVYKNEHPLAFKIVRYASLIIFEVM